MLTLILAFTLSKSTVPQELYDYLAKKDSSFKFEVKDKSKGELEMTSQIWQGHPWKHTILYREPSKVQSKGTAILFITGDGPLPSDYLDLLLVSESTRMPVAMLFDIPNQPIFGLREDDLIAYTFEKYLETKDPNWPLLFPMTKSAIRAMDAIQAYTKGTKNPIKRFVVTGASKRGWTTWFVGAARDKRVKGIAPMVIDDLNMAKQMKHQIDTWGFYSEEIQDYTKRGLQQKLSTPAGKKLAAIVDPFSYRANITAPTLIVKGANDPYWTADALSQYWDDLREPKWAVTIPNTGHDLGNKVEAVESIGAFARSVAGDFAMPDQHWSLTESKGPKRTLKVSLSTTGPKLVKFTIWAAEADTQDFRESAYKAVSTVNLENAPPAQAVHTTVPLSTTKDTAVFAEARYEVGARHFDLCCPTKVFKKR